MSLTNYLPAPEGVPLVDEAEGMRRLSELLTEGSHALTEAILDATADIAELHRHLGSGAQRAVYVREDWSSAVYKLPLSRPTFHESLEAHVAANLQEVWLFEGERLRNFAYSISGHECNGPLELERPEVAPCYVVWHESGIPIVVMERLSPERDHPDWADHMDGPQGGWSNLLDEWVLYDAGWLCQASHEALMEEFHIELAGQLATGALMPDWLQANLTDAQAA
jgi:hypothetical protein